MMVGIDMPRSGTSHGFFGGHARTMLRLGVVFVLTVMVTMLAPMGGAEACPSAEKETTVAAADDLEGKNEDRPHHRQARQDENGEHDGTALCRANHCQVDGLLQPKLEPRPRQFMCERRLPRLCGRDHGRRLDILASHDRTRRDYQPASQPRGIQSDSEFAASPRLLNHECPLPERDSDPSSVFVRPPDDNSKAQTTVLNL
jgi:hypothetical protein